MTKAETLKIVYPERDFVNLRNNIFKSQDSDALVLTKDELEDLVSLRVKEEIPYLENKFLKQHLPEKFHNDIILSDMKELCKFDHTILSRFILDQNVYQYDVLASGDINIADLILNGSVMTIYGDNYVLNSDHE